MWYAVDMKRIANVILNILASDRIVTLGMAVAVGVTLGIALFKN